MHATDDDCFLMKVGGRRARIKLERAALDLEDAELAMVEKTVLRLTSLSESAQDKTQGPQRSDDRPDPLPTTTSTEK